RLLMDVWSGGFNLRSEATAGVFGSTSAAAAAHQASIAMSRTISDMRNAFDDTRRTIQDVIKSASEGQALTREQQEWRRANALSLDAATVSGAANQQAIATALENVRAWGQAMDDSGASVAATTT